MKSTRIQLFLLQNVLLVCIYVAVAVVFPSCPMLKPTLSFLLRRSDDGALYASVAIGWIALIWYTFILAVCGLGYFQMYDSALFFQNSITNAIPFRSDGNISSASRIGHG